MAYKSTQIPNGVEAVHVDPDKEVSILAVGSESVFAALQKGAVDAAILWAPGFAIAEKLGMVRLQSLADIMELPGSGVVVSDQLIKENPLLIKKFLRGTIKGFHYVHANTKGLQKQEVLLATMSAKIDDSEENHLHDVHLSDPTRR